MRKVLMGAALAALAVAVPAAAQNTPTPSQPSQPTPSSQPSTTPSSPTTPSTTPSTTPVTSKTIMLPQDDASYAAHMLQHHRVGIALADQILTVTDDAQVKKLARKIRSEQQREITVLERHAAASVQGGQGQGAQRGTTAQRGGTTGTGVGAGAQHGAMHAGMHAAMMDPDLQRGIERLKTAKGTEADRLFLELMVVHHAGGLMVDHAAQDRLTAEDLKRLARDGFGIQARQIGELARVREGMASRAAQR